MKINIKNICHICNGAGYNPNSGEEEICYKCKGLGIITKKEKETEILRHSPTIDEFVEAYKRKKGLIK